MRILSETFGGIYLTGRLFSVKVIENGLPGNGVAISRALKSPPLKKRFLLQIIFLEHPIIVITIGQQIRSPLVFVEPVVKWFLH